VAEGPKTPRRKQRDPWPPLRPGIGAWFRDHIRIAAETMHFVSARLGTSLVVWLLVGIALALPAGLLLIQVNLSALTSGWEGRPGLTVYFKLTTEPEQITAAARVLEANEAIVGVKVTSREEALEEFRSFTSLADALAVLDENPLPASLSAALRTGLDDAALSELLELAEGRPGVEEVVVEKTWLERVNDISSVVSRLGVILGVLFGVGAVLVTATSVRLAIEARLEELRVQKLVGASDRQIRRPFLYFGAFYGIGGGLIAAMLLSLCLVAIEAPLTTLLGSYDQQLETAGFNPVFLVTLLLIGGILGVIGALMAAAARLRDLEIL
jgi:cell division transport system permease protein